jgi:hypothetical protein
VLRLKQVLVAPAAVMAGWIVVRKLIFVFGCAAIAISCAPHTASAAEDGKRTVDVPRYGVRTRVPQAWSLIDWGTGERAFELMLPQDRGSKVGFVRCTMTPAPESLEALEKKVIVAVDDPAAKPQVTRTLKADEIAPLASPAWPEDLVKRFSRRLAIEWECEDSDGRRWYERTIYVIGDGLMYAFSIESDEAHYDSFALDFKEMFAELRIKTPDNKLQQLESGHWLQRDFRFGLKLPEKWRPVFSVSDRALFFATGNAHGMFTDSITVHASLLQPQNLEQLKLDIPERTKKLDPSAAVECRIVDHAGVKVLETVVRSKRRGIETTTLERRFQTRQRNYEVKLNCLTEEFGKREEEFRAALETFIELAPVDRSGNAT